MSEQVEISEDEVVRAALEMANDLIDRDSDDKEADYWEVVRFLDNIKDNHAELLEGNPELQGQVLETLAVALFRGGNMVQADAMIDRYKILLPDAELPLCLLEVEEGTASTFGRLDI